MSRILIVDDDQHVRGAFGRLLHAEGYTIEFAGDGDEGLASMERSPADLVIVDYGLPGMTGVDFLERLRGRWPDAIRIMVTGQSEMRIAEEAVNRGSVYRFFLKPWSNEDLVATVRQALHTRDLEREVERLSAESVDLRQALDRRYGFENLIGASERMESVFRLIEQVAGTDAAVLIQGESGTGKELVARAIYLRSRRKPRPFVPINCAALTETLIESELFGHERGAFTGALAAKRGLFEAANGGTIFLDEVGEIPMALQAKLLRVLQSGEFKRVGGVETLHTDVRVISASNRDLAKAVEEKRFREDLFYRLNVVSVELPPLRKRRNDIPALAQAFLKRFAEKSGRPVERIAPQAMRLLLQHSWPGNVRELENVLERAVVVAQKQEILPADLPASLVAPRPSDGTGEEIYEGLPYHEAKDLAREAFHARYFSWLLRRTSGNLTSAARMAGMDRSNFRKIVQRYAPLGGDGEESEELPEENAPGGGGVVPPREGGRKEKQGE